MTRRPPFLQQAAEAVVGGRAIMSSKVHRSILEVTGGCCYHPQKAAEDELQQQVK